ncbi:MAG: hypothetical protein QME96_01785, partial [Myxococcota bacterium]|nr:hypothetical protein [Myxococcota bacterium]
MTACRGTVLAILVTPAALGCSGSDSSTDPCSGVRCSGHGSCFVESGAPYCACDRGYHPVALACVENDGTNPCNGVDCNEHGTCIGDAGYPTCDCEPGFASPPETDLLCFSTAAADADADVPITCGDGTLQAGEQCDDGNDTPDDGCEDDCRFSCRAASECNDDDPCTTDLCSVVPGGQACSHVVVPGVACDDGEACTHTDRCDADGNCAGTTYPCEAAPCEDASTCDGTGG